MKPINSGFNQLRTLAELFPLRKRGLRESARLKLHDDLNCYFKLS